ncbi:MAG: hypothetical protein AB7S70_11360 [Hyphomicrobium sp.]|uniref:hypothetical protein n=1 Tax=Hyphomicrobium sp. TaxID=82 RepID=UPI003D0B494C
MKTYIRSLATGVFVICLGLMFASPGAEARKIGRGAHLKAGKIAHSHPRARHAARHIARDVRRAGRWVNGVWIVNGVAASVAVGTASNCGYYWRKWRETGSAYWRERYYEHGCG